MKLKFTVRDLQHGSWDNTRNKLLALGFVVDEYSESNEVELRHENPDAFSDCAQTAKHLMMKHDETSVTAANNAIAATIAELDKTEESEAEHDETIYDEEHDEEE